MSEHQFWPMVHSTVCLQTDSDSILLSATLKMEAVHKEVRGVQEEHVVSFIDSRA